MSIEEQLQQSLRTIEALQQAALIMKQYSSDGYDAYEICERICLEEYNKPQLDYSLIMSRIQEEFGY